MPRLESNPLAAAGETRFRPRVRTALACQLSHGPRSERVTGIVRDIHEDGARIRPLCDPAVIAGPIELAVNDRTFMANLVWRNSREIGLSFVADLSDEQEWAILKLRAAITLMEKSAAKK